MVAQLLLPNIEYKTWSTSEIYWIWRGYFAQYYTVCNTHGLNLPDDFCRHINTGLASLLSMLKMGMVVCECETALQEVSWPKAVFSPAIERVRIDRVSYSKELWSAFRTCVVLNWGMISSVFFRNIFFFLDHLFSIINTIFRNEFCYFSWCNIMTIFEVKYLKWRYNKVCQVHLSCLSHFKSRSWIGKNLIHASINSLKTDWPSRSNFCRLVPSCLTYFLILLKCFLSFINQTISSFDRWKLVRICKLHNFTHNLIRVNPITNYASFFGVIWFNRIRRISIIIRVDIQCNVAINNFRWSCQQLTVIEKWVDQRLHDSE